MFLILCMQAFGKFLQLFSSAPFLSIPTALLYSTLCLLDLKASLLSSVCCLFPVKENCSSFSMSRIFAVASEEIRGSVLLSCPYDLYQTFVRIKAFERWVWARLRRTRASWFSCSAHLISSTSAPQKDALSGHPLCLHFFSWALSRGHGKEPE